MSTHKEPCLLLISQVFIPDPAAVGQYMADVATEMRRRGWYLKVYAASRGYDDPRIRYPRHENCKGVHICRLPLSSFGKRNIALRLAGQLSFVTQTFLRGVLSRRLDAILVTTSPPMGAVVAWAITFFRRVPIIFWVMDMNPDQAVRLGAFSPRHPLVRIFDFFLYRILRRSRRVVALDAYMARRLAGKLEKQDTVADGWEPPATWEQHGKLSVLPPWPMEHLLEPVAPGENPFRIRHAAGASRVLMYSGNHSMAHPIATFLHAALALRDEPAMRFLFVGGGKRKGEVDEIAQAEGLQSLVSLPYQPLEEIRFSLSAADVHLVSMGEDMVGCVHPCKVYGALALGRPILLLGPAQSHVGDLVREAGCGWQVNHGDVAAMEAVYREILSLSDEELTAMGARGRDLINRSFREDILLGQFADWIEQELPPGKNPASR